MCCSALLLLRFAFAFALLCVALLLLCVALLCIGFAWLCFAWFAWLCFALLLLGFALLGLALLLIGFALLLLCLASCVFVRLWAFVRDILENYYQEIRSEWKTWFHSITTSTTTISSNAWHTSSNFNLTTSECIICIIKSCKQHRASWRSIVLLEDLRGCSRMHGPREPNPGRGFC